MVAQYNTHSIIMYDSFFWLSHLLSQYILASFDGVSTSETSIQDDWPLTFAHTLIVLVLQDQALALCSYPMTCMGTSKRTLHQFNSYMVCASLNVALEDNRSIVFWSLCAESIKAHTCLVWENTPNIIVNILLGLGRAHIHKCFVDWLMSETNSLEQPITPWRLANLYTEKFPKFFCFPHLQSQLCLRAVAVHHW